MSASTHVGRALRIADDAWAEVRRAPSFGGSAHGPVHTLPDVSLDDADRRAAFGHDLLGRIGALDLDVLPGELKLTVEIARLRAQTWAREPAWWWLVFDPMRVGFFALFAPTAYAGGFLLSSLRPTLLEFQFREPGDLDRYLGLVADYARLVGQLHARTAGQAERGIFMPAAQLRQARALLDGLRSQADATLEVATDRLGTLGTQEFREALARRRQAVSEAFSAFRTLLDERYEARAPERVGLGQYAGGEAVYRELVRLHTTLDLTPEQVHAAGHARMQRIHAAMDAIAHEAGHPDRGSFERDIDADPAWRETTDDGVARVFESYLQRIRPVLPKYFRRQPKAEYGVAPLPAAMAGSMTFGYYEPPRPGRPGGRYLFNGVNLTQASLANLGALTYHELVPGHHLHLATQWENDALHPLRAYSFTNAYNEGWAEYAAGLAGEMGMYERPAERYGRLMMDAFLTCRLVVDTGMNVLGWSLEKAREYLRRNGYMSATEIASETVRYSCDIPAQALAYKLGDDHLNELRRTMQSRLGERFDIRDFHAAVLEPGALPLPLVTANVVAVTDRLAGEG